MTFVKNDVQMAFKAFTQNLSCRGFQYGFGKVYEHADYTVSVNVSGFHSCTTLLDVSQFYPPTYSRFCIVETSGDRSISVTAAQQATSKIALISEFNIREFTDRALENTLQNIKLVSQSQSEPNYSISSLEDNYSHTVNLGHCAISANAGDYSVAQSKGNRGCSVTTGDQSVCIGDGKDSVSSNTGNRSVATNAGGNSIAVSTGHNSVTSVSGVGGIAVNTGTMSNAIALGKQSVSVSSGHQSVAIAEGAGAIAIVCGDHSRAKAAKGAAMTIVSKNEQGELLHIKSGIAGKDIKANTWYRLDDAGNFIEVD